MHGNFAFIRNTYSTFSITDYKKQIIRSIEQPNSMVIERKSVTSRCHGSKISGSQQYFLDRDGHLHCRTMEKSMGKGKSCISISPLFVCFFFPVILEGPQFVEIQKCCYHGNVTSRLLLSIGQLSP